MKKQFIIIPVLTVSLLATGCDSNKKSNPEEAETIQTTTKELTTPEYVADQLNQDPEENVEFTLFRSGDSYFLYRDDDSSIYSNQRYGEFWTKLEGEIPKEIKINDFEFLHVKADLIILNGGIMGYSNTPMINKVHEQEAVSYDKVIENNLIQYYDRSKEHFDGPRICKNNGDTYIIVDCDSTEYRVYRNNEFINSYQTQCEANDAMRLATTDETVDYETNYIFNLYVFKCGNTYLAYIDHTWGPILNEEYRNEIANLTLKDGEMACLVNATIQQPSEDKRSYQNYMFLQNYETADKCNYNYFINSGPQNHREKNTPLENECCEYKSGKYLIFNLENKFYVYKDTKDNPILVGTYTNKEEVNEVLGIKK